MNLTLIPPIHNNSFKIELHIFEEIDGVFLMVEVGTQGFQFILHKIHMLIQQLLSV